MMSSDSFRCSSRRSIRCAICSSTRLCSVNRRASSLPSGAASPNSLRTSATLCNAQSWHASSRGGGWGAYGGGQWLLAQGVDSATDLAVVSKVELLVGCATVPRRPAPAAHQELHLQAHIHISRMRI
jgi:hypothetical protein